MQNWGDGQKVNSGFRKANRKVLKKNLNLLLGQSLKLKNIELIQARPKIKVNLQTGMPRKGKNRCIFRKVVR